MTVVSTFDDAVRAVVEAFGPSAGFEGCPDELDRLLAACNALPRPQDIDVKISKSALRTALINLGLPAETGRNVFSLPLPADEAAAQLKAAIVSPSRKRTVLCPLDLAPDDFPDLAFGPHEVRAFDARELDELTQKTRFVRHDRTDFFDSQRLSGLKWLRVTTTTPAFVLKNIRRTPSIVLHPDYDDELDRFDVHESPIEDEIRLLLTSLLLLPWEDYLEDAHFDRRPFRYVWHYKIDDDLFAKPAHPDDPDRLSWLDGHDRPWEPVRFSALRRDGTDWSRLASDAWEKFDGAQASNIWSPVVAHFLLRGFLDDEIDQFISHVICIEAAMGTASDYGQGSAADRVAGRIGSALGGPSASGAYKHLWNIRKCYMHGNTMKPLRVRYSRKHDHLRGAWCLPR